MNAISMMLVKLATLDLLLKKVFGNKGYDVIISVHDFSNKILSRESSYTVVKAMWPKSDNSKISMREVIITFVLKGYDQKEHLFWGVVFTQVR